MTYYETTLQVVIDGSFRHNIIKYTTSDIPVEQIREDVIDEVEGKAPNSEVRILFAFRKASSENEYLEGISKKDSSK